MPSIIALDIETTGLDSRRDAIIEIGAVRFNEEGIQDEWQSFINPGRPIPPFISQLTGIKNEDVVRAPPMKSVAAELAVFAEEFPILGQNIGFDLSFLRQYGILIDNPTLDTFELASVILPTAKRYNLGALAIELGLPITEDLHRALDDARLTYRVYSTLFQRMTEGEYALSADLISEVLRLSESSLPAHSRVEWGGRLPFEWAFRKLSRQGITGKKITTQALFEKQTGYAAPLRPNADIQPLDLDEVAAYLEEGGEFQKHFPGFEHRVQQVEMLRKVTDSFNNSAHLLVEASTGTGKSYAYLLPSALWALKNNTRVVISTNTINLQEQLMSKDIPAVQTILGQRFKACVLKGKNNYLCPRRLEAARLRPSASLEDLRVLAKVLVWLAQGGSGDRTEINLTGPEERDAWGKLSADDEACSMENCIKRTGGACPFYQARQNAQSSHLVVVNHALLLADVVTGSRVLPEYNYLVVDEGHHLEEATTNALLFRLTQPELERLFRELGGSSSGILGHYLTVILNLASPAELAAQEKEVKLATDNAAQIQNYTLHLFRSLEEFLRNQSDVRQQVQYAQQVRITPATRTQPDWTEVEITWDDMYGSFRQLLSHLNMIYQWLGEKFSDPSDEIIDTQGSLGNQIRRLTEIQNQLNGLVSAPAPDEIYWVELNNSGSRLSLNAAPLTVGPMMQQYLWNQKNSVIVTSATLTTAGEFSYLRARLNAEDADELSVGSPFDYENSVLLYLLNDIPEPTTGSAYQNEMNSNLLRLCKATNGRTLVLFTSYSQLKQTSAFLGPALAEKSIMVYEQGEGASAASLLESFKSSERSVLLGTRSFWEGVDIPGQTLSVVVITKLPFDVPSDPIIAARAETFDDPFNEYNLPEAILKFRQGFGRLIRTASDRGAVVVMDRRILTKKYGKLFLDSLPQCTLRVGSSLEMPRTVEKWLG